MNQYLTDQWHDDMANMLQRQGSFAGRRGNTTFYALDGKAYGLRHGTVTEHGDFIAFKHHLRQLKIELDQTR